ncbi:hypothetical protein [Agromyces seonyuensis]|uniref:Protein ImuA n=1 Tax=Agromyces seonyuensis TaxID=2662446 RepID=A0A6I4NUE3_9MICO|nr:hypothetical protein [Agromyces seonyuensis]MWB97853.1 hypothetical protein [Agromyces seonyuensis]
MPVSAPLRSPGTDRVAELQARIQGMQATKLGRELPTHPAIAAVLGGGLREGGVYRVAGATSLVMAMLAGPSAAGRWCAVVGMPGFGLEAAARTGIRLDRLALVPEPGANWLAVVAALADAVPMIALAQPGRVGQAEASRLAARLRQRGGVLVTTGEWPQAEASVRIARSDWHGLGDGHGLLADREALVERSGRGGFGPAHRVRLALPDASLAVSVLPEAPEVPVAPAGGAPLLSLVPPLAEPTGPEADAAVRSDAEIAAAELAARIRWAGGTRRTGRARDGRRAG